MQFENVLIVLLQNYCFILSSTSVLQNDSELFGRTIRVNIAAPQRIKEGSTRPVWSDDNWLQQHAGETLQINKENEDGEENKETTKTGSSVSFVNCPTYVIDVEYDKRIIKQKSEAKEVCLSHRKWKAVIASLVILNSLIKQPSAQSL